MASLGPHLFTFGVVTDLQWADIDDGLSHGGSKRYYRNSLALLKLAAEDFERRSVAFAFHLGDIVDGKHKAAAQEAGQNADQAAKWAVGKALDACNVLQKPFHHIIGNHCLYNLKRQQMQELLKIKGQNGRAYYAVHPHPGWRFLVLDTYDLSVLGWPKGSPEYQSAKAFLRSHNPNENWNDSVGEMGSPQRRFVAYGGGVGPQQLEWLQGELDHAKQQGQQVVVFSHCTLHPQTVGRLSSTLMWNYEEVLGILQSAGNVRATFAGHAHRQGFYRDETGIYHNVIPALLETPPGSLCHGFVKVHQAGIVLEGIGEMASHAMPWSLCSCIGAAASSN